MSSTLRSIWLPAMMSLLAIMGLIGAQQTGMFPHGFMLFSRLSLIMYVPFLLGFLLIGLLGAWLNRRTDGNSATHLRLCLLSVVGLLGMFLLFTPVSFSFLASLRNVGYFMGCFLRWVILPTIALVIGGLPFLLRSNRDSYRHNLDAGISGRN